MGGSGKEGMGLGFGLPLASSGSSGRQAGCWLLAAGWVAVEGKWETGV